MCTKLLLVIVSRLLTKCIMQMLFRCEISKFKIMPQSNVYKNIFTSSWTCCKPPKCKDLVVTQLAWDQALKWSGVKKKIGEQSEPDAIHPLLVRSMTVNKWVMNIDKKILTCMQMLLKLMHSSVKNVFDWSHNLIGMFLLTYLLQDNCKWANGWHRHKVYSPPPLPHTNPVFLPQATPCKLCSPISFFTPTQLGACS